MPIAVKPNAVGLLSYLGLDEAQINAMMEGRKCSLFTDGLRFIDIETGKVPGELKMPIGLAKSLGSCTLTPKNLLMLQAAAQQLFKKMTAEPELVITGAQQETFPVNTMKTAQCVKLRDATMLYQPVFGTSAGSRYFCVASNPMLKIAARWNVPKTLSIRAEGPGLHSVKSTLEDIGLSGGGDYMSMHLKCGDEMEAKKALGAVIAAVGAKFDTPMVEAKYIVN